MLKLIIAVAAIAAMTLVNGYKSISTKRLSISKRNPISLQFMRVFRPRVSRIVALSLSSPTTGVSTESSGSLGVEVAREYLNDRHRSGDLLNVLAIGNENLRKEMEAANFWTGGSFLVKGARCTAIVKEGLELDLECLVKGKIQQRKVMVPFLSNVKDETDLKHVLIEMAWAANRRKCTADLAALPFGEDYDLPLDFRWNEVPHQDWVRSYLYNAATDAVVKALREPRMVGNGSGRWKISVNFPEVNPAYDTYRIGTILEMIRSMALALAVQEGKKVRICVQQSLGEGVFAGMPLALSSMRPVLEKMDWGNSLTSDQKAKAGDSMKGRGRSEALIRFGTIGADVVADDDDVVIIIAPQNVVGGMIIGYLEELVKAAKGRPVILFNPLLADRPSSNNVMQIRGRAERNEFAKSFEDIYTLRILYPSSGGYMYPISGMVYKKAFSSPWAVYSRRVREEDKKEEYVLRACLPGQNQPDPADISKIFTDNY